MIASSRKSILSPPVTRRFEFTRLQNQSIALAYQALIPVVSRHLNGRGSRSNDNEPATTTIPESPIKGQGSLTSHASITISVWDSMPESPGTQQAKDGHNRQPA